MQKQLLPFMLLVLLATHTGQSFAQQLVVRLANGTEVSQELNQVRKLTFNPGEVSVVLHSGNTESYDMQMVQKLYFEALTSGTHENTGAFQQVNLYPNPANDIVYLSGLPQGVSPAFIFSLEGRLLLTGSVTPEANSIHLSTLKPGIYLLMLDGRAIKLIRL